MGVRYILESTIQIRAQDKIGDSQSLSNKIGMIEQVFIQVRHNLGGNKRLRFLNGLLIVRVSTGKRAKPLAESREDFVVRKGAPLDGLGIRVDVLGNKSCVFVLSCD